MRSSNLNVERYIYEDSQKVDIDQEFKKNLKNKIMSMQKENKTATRTSYLRVASFMVAAVLAGGSAFTAGNLYAKTSMNNMALKQNAKKYSETPSLVPIDSFVKNNAEIAQVINAKDTIDQSGKQQANITPSQGNIATNIATNPITHSVTDKGSSTQDDATNNQKNNTGDLVASADTPKPETTEVVLKMVSGRYMIQNIEVTGNEIVKTLPEEYNNATVEDSLKIALCNDEKLAFEKEGNIYMVRQTTKKVILVDSGTAPQVYAPINILSYIKQEPSKETNQPSISSVWVFDGNSAMKYNILTNNDGKYTYINTFWSNSGKELYILEENTQTKEHQILKVTLEIN